MVDSSSMHEVDMEWGCITNLMCKISDLVDTIEGGWPELIDMLIEASDECGREKDPATLFFTLYQFLFRAYYRVKTNPVRRQFDMIDKVTIEGKDYYRMTNYSYTAYKWAKANDFLWRATNDYIDLPVEKLSAAQRAKFEKRCAKSK